MLYERFQRDPGEVPRMWWCTQCPNPREARWWFAPRLLWASRPDAMMLLTRRARYRLLPGNIRLEEGTSLVDMVHTQRSNIYALSSSCLLSSLLAFLLVGTTSCLALAGQQLERPQEYAFSYIRIGRLLTPRSMKCAPAGAARRRLSLGAPQVDRSNARDDVTANRVDSPPR